MLSQEELAVMSDEQLQQLGDELFKRWRNNLQAEIAGSGTTAKLLRGGTKLRVKRVVKPNQERQRQLREEGSSLGRDSEMVRSEIRRRVNAQKARA